MKNELQTTTGIMGYTIEETKSWHMDSVRELCVKNQWYTRGTCKEYSIMLEYVRDNKPTVANIFTVAKDIFDHSDWNDEYDFEDDMIAAIMFRLNNEAVVTSYFVH